MILFDHSECSFWALPERVFKPHMVSLLRMRVWLAVSLDVMVVSQKIFCECRCKYFIIRFKEQCKIFKFNCVVYFKKSWSQTSKYVNSQAYFPLVAVGVTDKLLDHLFWTVVVTTIPDPTTIHVNEEQAQPLVWNWDFFTYTLHSQIFICVRI